MAKTYDEIKAEAQAISGASGKGSITKAMVGGTIEDLAEFANETDTKTTNLGASVDTSLEDSFYLCDSSGFVFTAIRKVDGKYIFDYVGKDDKEQWKGKALATYGDSVTAINNGNWYAPYVFDVAPKSWMWGNRVAEYLGFSTHYGRGIGGQGYRWQTAAGNGGSVSFINADGTLNSRNDSFNYDNYSGAVPEGTTKVRGCLAAWSRIKAMFPASIKDNIDVVLVMAHNDAYDTTACSFVENDTTDAEWASSGADYYGKIGGDYNLTTFRGGIASTIMKLQMWMPNAVIVLMTGISGEGTQGELNKEINRPIFINMCNAVKEMSTLTSTPCIDVFSTDGINGWNRTKYIADSIHPYTEEGGKMIGRAVIGGLKNILPFNY